MNKKVIGPILCIIGSIMSMSWILYYLARSFQVDAIATAALASIGETYESVGLINPTSYYILNATLSLVLIALIVVSAILVFKDIGKMIPQILLVILPLFLIIGRFIPLTQTQRFFQNPVYIFISPVYLTAGLLSGQWLGLLDGSYLIIDSIIILIGGILCLKQKK